MQGDAAPLGWVLTAALLQLLLALDFLLQLPLGWRLLWLLSATVWYLASDVLAPMTFFGVNHHQTPSQPAGLHPAELDTA